jgi:predicted amino acid racemase
MFLNVLLERNPEFIRAVLKLHDEGRLEANTYVLDMDAIRQNLRVMTDAARKHNLRLFPMTKQVGYNPAVHRAVAEAGIASFVAVDWMGARCLRQQGFVPGHIGHLVQPPDGVVQQMVNMAPEIMTVFSLHKARMLDVAARRAGRRQDILLRVYGKHPVFYPGHEGGFPASGVADAAREIGKLSSLRIVGVTSFPCFLFNAEANKVLPTANFETLLETARLLRSELGITSHYINAPGTNSSDLFETMAQLGATDVEPGHALTGTTPLATVQAVVEKPAVLYLSEISHMYNGRGHVFGGGLYIDPVRGAYPLHALVGQKMEKRSAELIPGGGIDYYGYIQGDVREGDPVIFGFRPQVFFTRGQVAPVEGVASGHPHITGYFDAQGHVIARD